MTRRVIVDTDTAGDDTQALVLSLLSERVTVDAVTVVAGNVEFEYEVENAKYTLDLLGRSDVPVYEGARSPLLKAWEHADQVHGEGGLGGDLFPDTGIDSADGHAVDAIVKRARAAPGEISLLCIGPLTNVALALAREPDLPDLLDEVVVMGGAVGTLGNDTPAAEYNFWVDPDAAKRVVRDLDVTLVDWGLTLRDGFFGPADFERVAALDTPTSEFFETITERHRTFSREQNGTDGVTLPDSLAAACLLAPELVDREARYHVDVDEREGLTRGYSLVDVNGVLDEEPNATVVESVDADRFTEMVHATLAGDAPESVL
ncbi:nucleoside hydrolase [Salinigranum halophilum]|uniref:nucleoside hydrolase n=1 Tax=Salinigranum halophilum TaxID=2565931 RepID=UPI00115CDDE3|nr:nucleoside hydrolase [Salinigranum halophilum]